MVDLTQRSCWILCLASMLAGCFQTGLGDKSSAGKAFYVSSSIIDSAPGLPIVPLVSSRLPAGVSVRWLSLDVLPPAAHEPVWPSITLVQRRDGGVVLRAKNASASMLQGLDPFQLDPAVLPFVLPTCSVHIVP
jgi:hypothetical protein